MNSTKVRRVNCNLEDPLRALSTIQSHTADSENRRTTANKENKWELILNLMRKNSKPIKMHVDYVNVDIVVYIKFRYATDLFSFFKHTIHAIHEWNVACGMS